MQEAKVGRPVESLLCHGSMRQLNRFEIHNVHSKEVFNDNKNENKKEKGRTL